nr:MAG TPA: hypothetical protein [Caudoviricetes sp.]
MKSMKSRLILTSLAFFAIISGCRTQKTQSPTLSPVVLNNSDSVHVETIVKIVEVPIEVSVDIPQQSESKVTACDSSHVETDLAESEAWINLDGTLSHSIRNKPGQFNANIFVPQTTQETNKEAVKIREIPVPQPYPVEVERKFTRMEQFKLAAFWYLVGITFLSLGFIFRKPFFTALKRIF